MIRLGVPLYTFREKIGREGEKGGEGGGQGELKREIIDFLDLQQDRSAAQ